MHTKARLRPLDRNGRLLYQAIGEAPTEEELFRFMADVDEDGTGEIEYFASDAFESEYLSAS